MDQDYISQDDNVGYQSTDGYQNTDGYQGAETGYQSRTDGYQGAETGYQSRTDRYQGAETGYQSRTDRYQADAARYQADIERRKALRKKRHREAVIRRIIAIVSFVIIIVGIGLTIFALKQRTPSIEGIYERKIDITQSVNAAMVKWLSSIGDDEIDEDYVAQRIQSYYITENLTLSKDENGVKTYSRSIDESSYDEVISGINSDLNAMLCEIISGQLVDKGYADNVTKEEAEQIAQQVLGMSAGEYLTANDVQVGPQYDDVVRNVMGTDTNQSGTYDLKKNTITITLNGNETTENIMFDKGTLVFRESGRVYYAK